MTKKRRMVRDSREREKLDISEKLCNILMIDTAPHVWVPVIFVLLAHAYCFVLL